jgi:hypothetical protein
MSIGEKLREPVRDEKVLPVATAKLKNNLPSQYQTPVDLEFVRAFSWFRNSSVPSYLQPLLKSYIKWTHTFIADPRDTIFVSHILFSLATIVPSALWLLYRFNWIHAILHTVSLIFTIPPFILMLHCTCHKKVSKTAFPWVDNTIYYVLAPFYGQTWNTFYYHHVKHHHIEDNGVEDLSSTIWYDRDNLFHFLIYFFRFYFLIVVELPWYFFKKGRYWWGTSVFLGEVSTFSLYYLCFQICENPLSVVFALIVPLNFSRIGMMSGNFTQQLI